MRLPGVCRKPPCHYLYYRHVPCPPDDYKPPKGASPQTWPQIYRNLQNIDHCTYKFKSIKNSRRFLMQLIYVRRANIWIMME